MDRRLATEPIAGIIFDLEGTLVDFQWHLDEAEEELRAGFASLGFPPGDFVGESYATMWNRAVTSSDPAVDEHVLRAQLGPIYDRFDHDALSRWAPRAGAADLLARLHRQGYRLGMASNIGRSAVGPALARFGLASWLNPVVTRDDVRHMKPHGEGVRRCLADWSLPADAVLMVGDSRSDLGAARHAGVRVAIILGGESGAEVFADDPPDYLLSGLLNLEPLLSEGRPART